MLIPAEAPAPCQPILVLAEHSPQRALPLAQAQAQFDGNDPLARAWNHYTLGWVLFRQNEPTAALSWFEQASATFAGCGLELAQLHSERAYLLAQVAARLRPTYGPAWLSLIAAYRTIGTEPDACRTQIQYAAYLNRLGRYQEAYTCCLEIQTTVFQIGSLDDQARWGRVAGIAAGHIGAFAAALSKLEAATVAFERLDYPSDVAKCHFERGSLFERYEQFAEASQALSQAATIFSALGDRLQSAVCKKMMGLLQSRRGHFDQALRLTLEAQHQFRLAAMADQAADCELNIGVIAHYNGLFDLALLIYRRAEQTLQQIGVEREVRIARRNQAIALHAMKRSAHAVELLHELQTAAALSSDTTELTRIYQAQADIQTDLGHFNLALELLRLIVATDTSLAGPCALDQGWLHLAQNQLADALACFAQAQPLLAERPMLAWRLSYGLARCAHLVGETAQARLHYQNASAILAQLRTVLHNEQASSGFFQQAAALFNDALALAHQQQDWSFVLHLVEQQRTLVLQRERLDWPKQLPPELFARYEQQRELLHQLTLQRVADEVLHRALLEYMDGWLRLQHSVNVPEPLIPATLDIEHLRTQLNLAYGAGWICLLYAETTTGWLCVALEAGSANLHHISAPPELSNLLTECCSPEYQTLTYLDLLGNDDLPWSTLRTLAEWLLPASVRAQLHADQRLLIVPSGRLHRLPWAALRLDVGWLCEQAIIQILPALSLWEPLQQRHPSSNAALLLGCRESSELTEKLENVAAELATVAAHWPGPTTQLLDAAATHAAVRDRLRSTGDNPYQVLHVATHAWLTAHRGVLARCALWDTQLFYHEISHLQLQGALVVLSTCDGAVSEVLPGEEILSLSWAFLAAGARDVIASLWVNNDREVARLMGLLYAGLGNGLDAPTALAQAQRQYLAQASDQSRAAIGELLLYCAGFQALGAGTAAPVPT